MLGGPLQLKRLCITELNVCDYCEQRWNNDITTLAAMDDDESSVLQSTVTNPVSNTISQLAKIKVSIVPVR